MNAAAFYDFDGTLSSTNVVKTYAYYAANVPSITDKIRRTTGLLAKVPVYMVADKIGRKFFNDIFFKSYEGIDEDRLHVLGEEMFDRMIRGKIYPMMIELMKRSREEGYRQVLVTGSVEPIVRPIAEFLEVDDYFANELEIIGGVATGRVVPPVLAGPEKARVVREYVTEHGLDLTKCRAYADSASDIPMLSAVGRPVAVNPDMGLRSTARAHDWPILNCTSSEAA